MLVVSWFICGFLYFLVYCFFFCEFTSSSSFNVSLKMLFISFIIGLLYYFMTKYNLIYIRPYFIHLSILTGLLVIYKSRIIKTLITIISVFVIQSISELLFGCMIIFVFKIQVNEFILGWFPYLFSNLCIFTTSIFISKIPFVKNIIKNIINWNDDNEFKSTIIFVALCMIVFTFFLYNNFIEVLPNQLLWLTNMFCIAVTFFVINYFKEKANNNRIVTEYDQLLKYVNKYEKVVEDKSKRQHEYKNQLVLIKGMINKTNKKAIEYIDSLYEEEKDDSNLEMLKKLQYLPSGGLKGLIYYKLEDMKDKKINVFVDISPKAKNVKVNKKIDSNLKDISKVIGVYLDNAIEASVHSKEKYIVLEIYLDKDEWVFSLSNTYKGEINLNRIDNEGYTTKGSGKGYGLSIVKDIISRNSDLRQERELRGIYYTQRLYMKK